MTHCISSSSQLVWFQVVQPCPRPLYPAHSRVKGPRVGAGEDETNFFSLLLRSLYVGVANCRICSGVNPLQMIQSFLRTQASSPTPLSRHLAHLKWPSKLTITWPHVPRFCPGDDMMVDKSEEILGSKIQKVKFVVEIKKRLC